MPEYLGAAPSTYAAQVGAKCLIACVARVYSPGCQVDTVVTLEGQQGRGKSTALRILARRPEWFFDSEIDIGSKEGPQALRGKWIVEIGELAALSKHETTRIKAFVSRRVDSYRPAYARRAADFPRRWAGFGTTNASAYLQDETGNRRWWPVRTGRIDLGALEREADQLWAEAVVRYQQHEPWHVDSSEFATACTEQQEQRVVEDAWEALVVPWLARRVRESAAAGPGAPLPRVSTGDVLCEALGIEPERWGRAEQTRVGIILRRVGWEAGPRPADEDRTRTYVPSHEFVVRALASEQAADGPEVGPHTERNFASTSDSSNRSNLIRLKTRK